MTSFHNHTKVHFLSNRTVTYSCQKVASITESPPRQYNCTCCKGNEFLSVHQYFLHNLAPILITGDTSAFGI